MFLLLLLFVFTLSSDFCLKEYRGKNGCGKSSKMVFHQYIKKGVCFNFEDSWQKYSDGKEGVLVEYYNSKSNCEEGVKRAEEIDFPLNEHLMSENYCREYERVQGSSAFSAERPSKLGQNEFIETVFSSNGCKGDVVSQYWSKIDFDHCNERKERPDRSNPPQAPSRPFCEDDGSFSIESEDGECVEEIPFDWESFLLYVLIIGSVIGIILVLILCFLSIALVFMEKNEEKKAETNPEEESVDETDLTSESQQATDTDFKTDLDSTEEESTDLGSTTEED